MARDEHLSQEDTERVQESLKSIIHVLGREDVDAPPSVYIKIERHCQQVWHAVGGGDVDEIYPEYLLEDSDE